MQQRYCGFGPLTPRARGGSTALDVMWQGEAGHGAGPTRRFYEKVAIFDLYVNRYRRLYIYISAGPTRRFYEKVAPMRPRAFMSTPPSPHPPPSTPIYPHEARARPRGKEGRGPLLGEDEGGGRGAPTRGHPLDHSFLAPLPRALLSLI